jgi:hypothetical protein
LGWIAEALGPVLGGVFVLLVVLALRMWRWADIAEWRQLRRERNAALRRKP